jgi:hypothetical protein
VPQFKPPSTTPHCRTPTPCPRRPTRLTTASGPARSTACFYRGVPGRSLPSSIRFLARPTGPFRHSRSSSWQRGEAPCKKPNSRHPCVMHGACTRPVRLARPRRRHHTRLRAMRSSTCTCRGKGDCSLLCFHALDRGTEVSVSLGRRVQLQCKSTPQRSPLTGVAPRIPLKLVHGLATGLPEGSRLARRDSHACRTYIVYIACNVCALR